MTPSVGLRASSRLAGRNGRPRPTGGGGSDADLPPNERRGVSSMTKITRRTVLAARRGRAIRAGRCPRPGVARQVRPLGGALHGGRPDRCRHAPDAGEDQSRPELRGRQQARRQLADRRGVRRQCAARRLHLPDGDRGPRGEQDALCRQAEVRSGHELRAGVAGRHRADDPVRHQRPAGEERRRADRVRQEESRQDLVRLLGRRRGRASHQRAA